MLRVDRFINLIEADIGIQDSVLLSNIHRLLDENGIELNEILIPYLRALLENQDLVREEIIKNNHLTVKLAYKNGNEITNGYTKDDLEFIISQFENIIKDLRGKLNNG